jgi:repressor of nif and glnA expression
VLFRSLRGSLNQLGLGRILAVGQPEQPLFDLPVSRGAVGLVVLGGLNPIAAACEAGIAIRIAPLAGLHPYAALKTIDEIRGDIRAAVG